MWFFAFCCILFFLEVGNAMDTALVLTSGEGWVLRPVIPYTVSQSVKEIPSFSFFSLSSYVPVHRQSCGSSGGDRESSDSDSCRGLEVPNTLKEGNLHTLLSHGCRV